MVIVSIVEKKWEGRKEAWIGIRFEQAVRGRSFVSQCRYTARTLSYWHQAKPFVRARLILLEKHGIPFFEAKRFSTRGVRFEPPLRGAISLLLNLKRCLVCSPASYRAERFLESYSSRRLNCTARLFTPFRDLRNCCFAPGSWVSIVFATLEILFGYF